MRAGKIIALVVGILMVLIAIGLLVPGSVLLGLYGTQRDDAGFFETSSRTLSSNGYALVTPDVEVNMGPLAWDWLPTGDRTAVRIKVTSSGDAPAFVGIGPSNEVARYLAGVEYDEVTNFGWAWMSVEYRHLDGGAPSSPPEQESFWVAQEEGSGTLTLEWDVEDGNWTAVVMNGDASASVYASVSLGALFDILLPIGIGMTVAGIVLLVVGIVLIVVGARRTPTPAVVQAQVPPQSAGSPPPAGPPAQG
jgi:hypothetical protein